VSSDERKGGTVTVRDLKTRLAHADYEVDPQAVAEALLLRFRAQPATELPYEVVAAALRAPSHRVLEA
jgi:RecB family exonuclease